MPNFHLEKSGNKEKNSLLVSPYFFALAVVFTATFGLLFLSNFRSYRSDISVLIIPKNESASFQADQIVENLVDITHRLSFYDRVLFDNPEIEDPFADFSKDERKARWNETFTISRLPGSTTLNISVFNQDKDAANKVARQMALSLSEVASRFYNIQTELELRIIEGPISSTYIRAWQWLIFISILAGLSLAYLVLFIFNLFTDKVQSKMISGLSWNKIEPQRAEYPSERDYFAPSAERREMPSHAVKKAGAPSNLPIADEKVEKPAEIFASLEEPALDEKKEPTDEEYRERLNKLLRGEI